MTHYLILATIIDPALFADYIKGHIPTIARYGGRVTFRSTDKEDRGVKSQQSTAYV